MLRKVYDVANLAVAGSTMGAKHFIHHQGSPRPDPSGLLPAVIGLAGAVGVVLLVVIFVASFWPWLLGLGVTAAASGTGWAIYRHFTHLQRLASRVESIRSTLEEQKKTYQKAREALDSLSANDRPLANSRLAAMRFAGIPLCAELRELRNKVGAIKRDIMQRLGTVPVEELNKRLAPLTAIETEIDRIVQEYDAVMNSER